MKKMLTAGVCLASFLGLGLQAETVNIKVTLPYAATVGATNLPAGDYTISEIKEPGGSQILLFRSSNGLSVNALAMPITDEHARTGQNTEVVLHQVGGKYEVEKVWIGGEDRGYELLTATR